jgi:hypothetical protein
MHCGLEISVVFGQVKQNKSALSLCSYKTEQIMKLLRQLGAEIASGKTSQQKKMYVTAQAWDRWREGTPGS